MAGSVGGPFQEAGGPLRSLRRAWYPAPPTRDRTGTCGTLPFIHKLLEVLGEDTTGQLRRRLWERTDSGSQMLTLVLELGRRHFPALPS